MFDWLRQRNRSDEAQLEFLARTAENLDTLRLRIREVEEELEAQQSTGQTLEDRTARGQAEASVARLEVRDLIHQYGAPEDERVAEAEQPHILDDLMPAVAASRPDGTAEDDDEPGEGPHLCLFRGRLGYELAQRPGAAPAVGDVVDLSEHNQADAEVLKVGRSPLPGDDRRCAYLMPTGVAGDVREASAAAVHAK